MKAILGALALLAVFWQPITGCSLCTDFPGASGILSPRLLEIASAIRHELDSGGLEPNPAAPLPTGGRVLGYRMAGLLQGYSARNESLELVLIDSGARFRFDPRTPESGFEAVSKNSKIRPAKQWVTGLEVFHAILDGRMPIDTAEIRGVLVVEPWKEGELLGEEVPISPGPETGGEMHGKENGAASGRTATNGPAIALAVLVAFPVLMVLRSRKRNALIH